MNIGINTGGLLRYSKFLFGYSCSPARIGDEFAIPFAGNPKLDMGGRAERF